jgi:hypothetical protein
MLRRTGTGLEPITPKVFRLWHSAGHQALLAMGISDADADIEARIITNTMYGLQYDLIVNGDEERATEAFDRALESYRHRIVALKPELVDRLTAPTA